MKAYTSDEYEKAGCKELTGAMWAVFMATRGKVCDTGCYAFNEGRCPAYQNLTIISYPPIQESDSETVRQEASRRGISISEVRRQRHEKIERARK